MTIYKDKQFQIILSGLLLIIFLRFFYLQIYQHQKYENQAGANSIRKISLHAPRGIIFDRFSIPLVDNLQIYDLAVIPFDVTEKFNYSFRWFLISHHLMDFFFYIKEIYYPILMCL